MELKNYQKNVLKDLSEYMNCLNRSGNLVSAWREFWFRKDINVGFGGVPAYQNTIDGVPHVCMKVPTGGGKTFIAASAIKPILNAMPQSKAKVVVWLVPSEAILTQTIQNLSDVNHPYRQKLDADFAGRVGVYTKEQLLNGQNFSPDTVEEMLSICVMSFASLRINKRLKDVRKVYQENGNLLSFTGYQNEDNLLEDTPDTALINVLRQLLPIAIVDESHNASSDLSVEMLERLNPSFILDLTATPRSSSNVLSYVSARELKRENMVKLPVIVYNRKSRQDVVRDAIQLQSSLEARAKIDEQNGGEYIRPIVLFQAQPKIDEDSGTFEKVKSMLLNLGIPEKQIAIKTSEINELKDEDLLSKNCEVRFIITVNALKEGWDCPFAYILASLANKTSEIDVEQILGRILRQPYTKKHATALLNSSYVLTSSNDFYNTLDKIIEALNGAGFSAKDYRVADSRTFQNDKQEDFFPENSGTSEPVSNSDSTAQQETEAEDDNFSDISASELRKELDEPKEETRTSLDEMLNQAQEQVNNYLPISDSEKEPYVPILPEDMRPKEYRVQEQFRTSVATFNIPQLFYRLEPNLFDTDGRTLLEPETLSDGFSLREQDARISFELSTGEMMRVDIAEQGEAVPKYIRISKSDSQYIREYFATMPAESRIKHCALAIAKELNRNNRYQTVEVESYVDRIIKEMSEDELDAMETALPIYVRKIRNKIESLEEVYREQLFYQWVDAEKIFAHEHYSLPNAISPPDVIDSIPKSLYEAERNDLNNFERKLIDIIASLENVLWWHRIQDRKGFRINGFINHYPDFMVMTKNGKLLLIEAKGDYLDNDDSKAKLKLGRQWQELAGRDYRYFMVFENKSIDQKGAYTIDDFVEVLKEL